MPELWSPEGPTPAVKNRVKTGETGSAPAPTLGLAIIARDEEHTLPNLLASIKGAFDQVVLVDTGSEDATVEVFETWGARERPPLGYRWGPFQWRDDFAAARNAAHDLLDTDWIAWADCDDVVVGATDLRDIVAGVPADVDGLFCEYRLGRGQAPRPQRLRVVRREIGGWVGRVHESFHRAGRGQSALAAVDPDVARWEHRPQKSEAQSLQRNAELLAAWIDEEPEAPRPLGMLAAQELLWGDRARGLALFRRYNALRRDRTSAHPELTAWALQVLSGGPVSVELTGVLVSVLLSRPPYHWFVALCEPHGS